MTPTLPTLDEDSAPFWEACRAGHLSAQRCPSCGRFRWPPAEFCPHCHFHGGDWVALPGTGTVAAFVVVERAFDPGFAGRVPYVIAHVALDGATGVTIVANVEPVEGVAVGRRVVVGFEATGGVSLPRFRLMED